VARITIDGKAVEAASGASVLDAALAAGIYIPHLCSHPDLRPIGACGLCVCEIEGMDGLQKSCITEALDGMQIRTDSAAVGAERYEVMRRVLEEHPSDCDSCVKYLNCELQSLKQFINIDGIHAGARLRNLPDNTDNPIFLHNPGRCIRCGRCMRACHELRGVGVLFFKKRGGHTVVGVGAVPEGGGVEPVDAGMPVGDRSRAELPEDGRAGVPGGDSNRAELPEDGRAGGPEVGVDADAFGDELRERFADLTEEQLAWVSDGEDLLLADAGCRFCGACAEVCPTGAILDRHEFGSGQSRREALLPCVAACPAGVDVPRYLRFIRAGDPAAAHAVVREKVPFPFSLGYVCSRPCEGACRRGEVHDAVSIRDLKRFALEADTQQNWKLGYNRKAETGRRVAVVGGGPAGLSAGWYLNLLGHSATVFEARAEMGGVLRYGVPSYRLPREVLAADVAEIAHAGVLLRTGEAVADPGALLAEGFDAVLVAVGCTRGSLLRLRGAKGPGAHLCTDFLLAARAGSALPIGENVLVLGGGNVAFDCARVARRLGAENVALAFLEARDAMTAAEDEIEQGLAEGLSLHPAVSFSKILRDDEGQITGVAVQDVSSFICDEDGRMDIQLVPGSDRVLAADTVLFAVGQKPEIPEGFGLVCTVAGYLDRNPVTHMTERKGIFAAADCVAGTDSVVGAIATARATALKIDKYLGGRGRLEEKYAPDDNPETELGKQNGFATLDRVKEPLRPAAERLSATDTDNPDDFLCATNTLDKATAQYEAERCLKCDLRLRMTSVKFWGAY
jgi:NADPH-dependent glutamate synthase beta subunit-like oxidoreductase/ferredoxin